MAAELVAPATAHPLPELRVERAADGVARVSLAASAAPDDGTDTSCSGRITYLVDAAGRAAVIATAPDEAAARQLRIVATAARVQFHHPVVGSARAVCRLTDQAVQTVGGLFRGEYTDVRITTHVAVDTEELYDAVTAAVDWTVRLTAPESGR